MTKRIEFVSQLAAIVMAALLVAACAPTTPARQEAMVLASSPAAATAAGEFGSVFVTVYGQAGGFASHYYPLPREDFEAALLESMASGGVFQPVRQTDDPDFLVTVGLVHMEAPYWSGRVTLETSWSVTSAATGEALGREAITAMAPAEFSKKREATEAAAQENIAEGLAWLESVVGAHNAR
jgi:hypothetical protein